MKERKIYKLYLFGFYFIIAFSFIILFFNDLFVPFLWNKSIIFRIVVSVISFAFLSQLILKEVKLSDVLSKLKSIYWPLFLIICYLLASFVSTLLSYDMGFSFWGSPERAGGLINILFFVVFSLLLFLILDEKDWKRILTFSIITGVFCSFIAFFQRFAFFPNFLISYDERVNSTLGNPIFFAIYLLLLTFLSLSFFINSKKRYEKIFFLFSLLLFIFTSIFLSQTRAAFLGLIAGFLWFFFAYPKKIIKTKMILAVVFLFLLFGGYFLNLHLNSNPYLYFKIPYIIAKNSLGRMLSIFEGAATNQSRISSWKVSLDALKDRPVFGYGPENFEIGFNKYYDPSLSGIGSEADEWWDRAHNFFFDISIATGIPSFILYVLFFAVLFWQLQKSKIRNPIICNGLQAAFLGYFVSLLFSFDSFDINLILFLLVGYSFFLTQKESRVSLNIISVSYKYRIILVAVLFTALIWFVFEFNIKPIRLNYQLNNIYYKLINRDYKNALNGMDEVLSQNSIIDNYLRIKLVNIIEINKYIIYYYDPKLRPLFIRKTIDFARENIEENPYHLRDWFVAGKNTNLLIETKKGNMLLLEKEADYYFKGAVFLSPKRQVVYKEWAKTGLLLKDYGKAIEKAEKCIELNYQYGECYWIMALANGYLKDFDKLSYYLDIAKEKKYNTKSKISLLQLAELYRETGDLKKSEEFMARAQQTDF